jgi:hypothetical protein
MTTSAARRRGRGSGEREALASGREREQEHLQFSVLEQAHVLGALVVRHVAGHEPEVPPEHRVVLRAGGLDEPVVAEVDELLRLREDDNLLIAGSRRISSNASALHDGSVSTSRVFGCPNSSTSPVGSKLAVRARELAQADGLRERVGREQSAESSAASISLRIVS